MRQTDYDFRANLVVAWMSSGPHRLMYEQGIPQLLGCLGEVMETFLCTALLDEVSQWESTLRVNSLIDFLLVLSTSST